MKKYQIIAMAMLAVSFLTGCKDDAKGNEDENGGAIPVSITGEFVLEAGKTYTLDGGVHVKKGGVIKIEEGVTIIAQQGENNEDYLLIEQGARIEARGTKENPILMTSTLKEAGAWGGIHICGYASLNEPDATTTKESEIGLSTYGGINDDDDSGILEYIVLEYTGEIIGPEKEANGISFYGVGRGTTVQYCQAYRGADDGFEFFGGTVNVKYLIATSCSDDSFDWTGGWRGKAQFLVAYQEPKSDTGYDCDKMIEADNDKTTNDKGETRGTSSFPTIANITLVSENNNDDENIETNRGIRLRAGTEVKIYNAIVKGKTKAITVETDRTENSLLDGDSILEYITIDNELSSKQGIYTNDNFESVSSNSTNETVLLTDKYLGTISGGKNMSSVDSWFTSVDYSGAVKSTDDWTAGWSRK